MPEKNQKYSFKAMIRVVAFAAAVLFTISVFGTNVLATERGGGCYPNGVEGIMLGVMPPPGLYYLNYSLYYSADRMNDSDGDKLPVDLDLDMIANVSRFVYVTEYRMLGANYGMYVTIPLLSVDVSLDTPGGNFDDSSSGLGDVTVSPMMLSWHSKNIHTAAAFQITAPIGQYDAKSRANTGRNYWMLESILATTLLTDNGLELSTKFMYDINSENNDTHYKSGQEFHFDYATAYHMGFWAYGITGYFYKQVSDDGGTGAVDGNRGQAFAAGPAIWYKHKNMSFEARYQKEMLVENRPEGEKFWLKVIWAF